MNKPLNPFVIGKYYKSLAGNQRGIYSMLYVIKSFLPVAVPEGCALGVRRLIAAGHLTLYALAALHLFYAACQQGCYWK